MENIQVLENTQEVSNTSASWRRVALALLTYLFVAVMACLAIYQFRQPAATKASAPSTEFASERAMQHLKVIAAKPHPIGTSAAAEVGEYIKKSLSDIGLAPEVQQAVGVRKRSQFTTAATAQNILAQIDGTDPNAKAVLLMAHYDSVPHSFGASDDGAGVVTLLETMRALKAGPPLKNDVVALFTDGEEIGLIGAQAFVEEHPLAKNVGVVLNFEARGTSGPVFMFETSDRNGWLVREFARAAPYPVANSVMQSLYKLMPNDTDLSVTKKAGLPGLNFAYIDGASGYHTANDSYQAVDERSVQHEGSYALALARHFGNLNLSETRAGDAVYFNVFGTSMVSYPGSWVLPLAVGIILLFAAVTVFGLRRKKLTLGGIGLGLLVFLLGVGCAAGVVWLSRWLIGLLNSEYTPAQHARLYLISFVALALAAASALYTLLGRRLGVENLTMGALLTWLVLMVAVSLYMPGASYLFMWPLVGGLLAAAFAFTRDERDAPSLKLFGVLSLSLLPGIILVTSIAYMIFVGLSLSIPLLLVALEMLLLGLLIPYLRYVAAPFRWSLPLASAVVGLGFFLAAAVTPVQGADNPRMSSLFYSLDADTGEALWVSNNRRPDAWTSQVLPANAERRSLVEQFPNSNANLFVAKAPAIDAPDNRLVVLDDKRGEQTRTFHLRVDSEPNARLLSIYVEPTAQIQSAVINGKRVDYSKDAPRAGEPKWWELNYAAAPESGIDLVLEAKATTGQIKVVVASQYDGLPSVPGVALKSRPANLIPAQNSEITRVKKSFIIGETSIGMR